jgi:uncharacterized membrane protein
VKLKTADYLSLGFIAVAVLVTVSVYSQLPARVPTHFNVHGRPDGWMPRGVGVSVSPAIAAFLWLLLRPGAALLSAKAKHRMSASPIAAVTAVMAGMTCAMQGVILYAAIARPPSMAASLGLILGATWLLLGLIMPRVRRNPWVGVRTAWAMESDENWARANRPAGYAFVMGGFCAMLAVAIGMPEAAPFFIVVSALFPVVQSLLTMGGDRSAR